MDRVKSRQPADRNC